MRSTALALILAGAALGSSAVARPGGSAAETAARPDDHKVTCRYESVTGQLAGRVKRCLTGKEWRARSRNARAESEKMINRGFSCSDDHCQ
jgi:anaerobic selenocysteine-containing dehydrogenase